MTNFAYNRNIPASPNNPSNDQPLMQTNTNSTDDILEVNHVSFEANNGGLHTKVQFDANIAAPGLGGGVSALFPNLLSGLSTPFWQNSTQLYSLVGTLGAVFNPSGYLRLNNGLIIQWAGVSVDSDGNPIQDNSRFVFPLAYPNGAFIVVPGAQKASTGAEGLWISNGTLTQTQFRIRTSASSGQFTRFFYVSIGV